MNTFGELLNVDLKNYYKDLQQALRAKEEANAKIFNELSKKIVDACLKKQGKR